MPVSTKQKASRGVPRKSGRPSKKLKHARYAGRSTCHKCGLLLRSPAKKRFHELSGHKTKSAIERLGKKMLEYSAKLYKPTFVMERDGQPANA